MRSIPFNQPYISGKELDYIQDSFSRNHLSSNGFYTEKCESFLTTFFNSCLSLLTHSCTAALEIAILLLDLKEGDEIILPSYTFCSTANCICLQGITPVFVDIDPITLNISDEAILKAISQKTRAIVVVHYAGLVCDMDSIKTIARAHNLYIIEDAAQAFGSFYNGKPAGSLADIAAISFHETKNIISGEGGAIIINNEKFAERAQIIRDKGTNRKLFNDGVVDKYTWVDIGSSYAPSEMIAAFLLAQLENMNSISQLREDKWMYYYQQFSTIKLPDIRLPPLDVLTGHNHHCFYLILKTKDVRSKFINFMRNKGVMCTFHYIPLHNSRAGELYANSTNIPDNSITNMISDQLVRLPLYPNLTHDQIDYIILNVKTFFTSFP